MLCEDKISYTARNTLPARPLSCQPVRLTLLARRLHPAADYDPHAARLTVRARPFTRVYTTLLYFIFLFPNLSRRCSTPVSCSSRYVPDNVRKSATRYAFTTHHRRRRRRRVTYGRPHGRRTVRSLNVMSCDVRRSCCCYYRSRRNRFSAVDTIPVTTSYLRDALPRVRHNSRRHRYPTRSTFYSTPFFFFLRQTARPIPDTVAREVRRTFHPTG